MARQIILQSVNRRYKYISELDNQAFKLMTHYIFIWLKVCWGQPLGVHALNAFNGFSLSKITTGGLRRQIQDCSTWRSYLASYVVTLGNINHWNKMAFLLHFSPQIAPVFASNCPSNCPKGIWGKMQVKKQFFTTLEKALHHTTQCASPRGTAVLLAEIPTSVISLELPPLTSQTARIHWQLEALQATLQAKSLCQRITSSNMTISKSCKGKNKIWLAQFNQLGLLSGYRIQLNRMHKGRPDSSLAHRPDITLTVSQHKLSNMKLVVSNHALGAPRWTQATSTNFFISSSTGSSICKSAAACSHPKISHWPLAAINHAAQALITGIHWPSEQLTALDQESLSLKVAPKILSKKVPNTKSWCSS